MAVRVPVVIASGQLEQLQAGDTIAGGGSAATPTLINAGTTFTIDAGTQVVWIDGITVNGSIVNNGSLRGGRI